jgi:ABC-type branched-subunit amino acid transport system substrate-binding protein
MFHFNNIFHHGRIKMARILKFFMGSLLLIGLTSCSKKPIPETVPPSPSVKVKPIAPVAPPSPLPPEVSEPRVHKVGLLLPLSGPHAALGKGMQQAAEMALFEAGSTSVALLPQDTALGAHAAALKALDEGAEILLGPIFAAEVEAIKPLLNARKASLICFSTDQNVAGNGVYILGFLPSQQIERVMGFAQEKGLTKVAALLPDDQYGYLGDDVLRRLDSKGIISLVGTTRYTKGDILEGNPGNARLIEEVAAYKSKGMDALFIPEGGENLSHLINLLQPQMPFKILGSGQWDTPETFRIASLEGGLFASTSPQERQSFDARFQKAYGTTPPRIATLAYDGTALAMALADKGYTPQNLTFSQGFSGIDGIFRLTSQGLNERGLAILEVTSSGFRTVSPAPQTF